MTLRAGMQLAMSLVGFDDRLKSEPGRPIS